MFDMGFLPDVRRIIRQIPSKRQTMMFSATFPTEVEKLAAEALNAPKRIAVGLARPAHTVTHALYPVAKHLKTALTFELLEDRHELRADLHPHAAPRPPPGTATVP
jgi:ATP-dependent RNA helicase RhlE